MSKRPVLCNVKQTTLGPAHEQLQCALADIQAKQKTICRPERINTMLQILGFLLQCLETTLNTQWYYVKIISIATGLIILLL